MSVTVYMYTSRTSFCVKITVACFIDLEWALLVLVKKGVQLQHHDIALGDAFVAL